MEYEEYKEEVIETEEYKIVMCEYYTEVTIGNKRITVRKGDCYTLEYDDAPEHDNLAVSSDIEVIVKRMIQELKNPDHYWYAVRSWKDGIYLDGETFKGR